MREARGDRGLEQLSALHKPCPGRPKPPASGLHAPYHSKKKGRGLREDCDAQHVVFRETDNACLPLLGGSRGGPHSPERLRVGCFHRAPWLGPACWFSRCRFFGWIEAFKKVTPCILFHSFFLKSPKDVYKHELYEFYGRQSKSRGFLYLYRVENKSVEDRRTLLRPHSSSKTEGKIQCRFLGPRRGLRRPKLLAGEHRSLLTGHSQGPHLSAVGPKPP